MTPRWPDGRAIRSVVRGPCQVVVFSDLDVDLPILLGSPQEVLGRRRLAEIESWPAALWQAERGSAGWQTAMGALADELESV